MVARLKIGSVITDGELPQISLCHCAPDPGTSRLRLPRQRHGHPQRAHPSGHNRCRHNSPATGRPPHSAGRITYPPGVFCISKSSRSRIFIADLHSCWQLTKVSHIVKGSRRTTTGAQPSCGFRSDTKPAPKHHKCDANLKKALDSTVGCSDLLGGAQLLQMNRFCGPSIKCAKYRADSGPQLKMTSASLPAIAVASCSFKDNWTRWRSNGDLCPKTEA